MGRFRKLTRRTRTIHFVNVCSPNEDFGRRNKALRVRFVMLFRGVSTRFGLALFENSFKNAYATNCSAVQNLRLGSIGCLAESPSDVRPSWTDYD